MLREKVATLHLPVLGSVLFTHTEDLVLPPEIYWLVKGGRDTPFRALCLPWRPDGVKRRQHDLSSVFLTFDVPDAPCNDYAESVTIGQRMFLIGCIKHVMITL